MTRYEVRCNRCDLAGAGPRDVVCSYVDGENRLTVDRRLAWCHQCQDVVYGEAIQDLAQLEADLQTAVDQLDSLADDEQSQWLNAYLPDYIGADEAAGGMAQSTPIASQMPHLWLDGADVRTSL